MEAPEAQAAHAAISVIEGVDAKEVQDKHWHQKQGIQLRVRNGFLKSIAEAIHGFRSLPCWNRLESDSLCPVGQFLCNHIIGILEAAADGCITEFIEIPMQLQNHAWSDGNIIIVFVNRIQHIPISGDLAFTPSLGRSLIHHDLFQPVIGGDDALNAVGCFCALDLRNLQQLSQRILFCFDKQILLTFLLMDLSQV